MQAPGGEGTFFAGAIYAAQDSLVAAQAANPKAQNVMIILSDGDASASSSAMPGASTTSGVYPSTKNQCQQAVTAAAAAKTAWDKSLYRCLRSKVIRLLDGFACHYAMSDNAEDGIRCVDVLLRLHGDWRQHQLYFGCCARGGPGCNLHEDLRGSHTGAVDSRQYAVNIAHKQ